MHLLAVALSLVACFESGGPSDAAPAPRKSGGSIQRDRVNAGRSGCGRDPGERDRRQASSRCRGPTAVSLKSGSRRPRASSRLLHFRILVTCTPEWVPAHPTAGSLQPQEPPARRAAPHPGAAGTCRHSGGTLRRAKGACATIGRTPPARQRYLPPVRPHPPRATKVPAARLAAASSVAGGTCRRFGSTLRRAQGTCGTIGRTLRRAGSTRGSIGGTLRDHPGALQTPSDPPM